MSFSVKPGDTFTAKAIGTYPELPEWCFDEPEYNPDFWSTRQFEDLPEGVSDLMIFHGPKGTVVMAYSNEADGGYFTHYADEFGGKVLRRVKWNATTSTWDAVAA